ncbi:MAG: LCP family protein [Lachnospiraceae bacterium]|jgi:LCP family protein required for cell wall assembly
MNDNEKGREGTVYRRDERFSRYADNIVDVDADDETGPDGQPAEQTADAGENAEADQAGVNGETAERAGENNETAEKTEVNPEQGDAVHAAEIPGENDVEQVAMEADENSAEETAEPSAAEEDAGQSAGISGGNSAGEAEESAAESTAEEAAEPSAAESGNSAGEAEKTVGQTAEPAGAAAGNSAGETSENSAFSRPSTGKPARRIRRKMIMADGTIVEEPDAAQGDETAEAGSAGENPAAAQNSPGEISGEAAGENPDGAEDSAGVCSGNSAGEITAGENSGDGGDHVAAAEPETSENDGDGFRRPEPGDSQTEEEADAGPAGKAEQETAAGSDSQADSGLLSRDAEADHSEKGGNGNSGEPENPGNPDRSGGSGPADGKYPDEAGGPEAAGNNGSGDDSGGKHGSGRRGKGKKKHTFLKVILIILIILAILAAALYAAFRVVVGRMNYVPDSDVTVNTGVIYAEYGSAEDAENETADIATLSPEEESAIAVEVADTPSMDASQQTVAEKTFNLLLIGSDRRQDNWYGNSDAMILLTFNSYTDTIYMTSFMRDLYADIEGVGVRKLNAAHAIGGGPLLVSTLESNYGVQIDNYASVDFNSLAEIIDLAGGVDVQLSNAEASYLDMGLTGSDDGSLTHLDGEQAVAYARIRYVGNSDFERTSRQREVLSSLFSSLKSMGVTEAANFIYTVLPYITHNMDSNEILSQVMKLSSYLSWDLEEVRIPFDGYYTISNEILIPDMSYTIPTLQSIIYASGED